MPRSENQKLKLLVLAEIFKRETDENHALSAQQLIERLAAHEIRAERKTIYSDIAALQDFGMDIIHESGGYKLLHREFELPELKLLVDAVQASRFLSAKKSHALIAKLESLASVHEARALQRQVYVTNRVKSMNESIYYSIDMLHTAIAENKQISFQYFAWTTAKTQQFRHDGARYVVSPYALIWDDANYYLVAYSAQSETLRHYRVDKMSAIAMEAAAREGGALFSGMDMAVYARRLFGMFGGAEQAVTLQFDNRVVGVILDRFGRDITLIPVGDTHFRVHISVVPGAQFFGWVASFGAEAKIIAPASLADTFCKMYAETLAQYGE